MLRNVGSNWVVTLFAIAATYVLTPFTIRTLGNDGYGTWTLITAMTGYMSLLTLGVPMASVRFLAQHVAEGDPRKMNEAIGSCVGLYLMMGVVALVVGLALTVVFTALYDIPVPLRSQARLAFAVMALQVSMGFIGLLPEGIMFAHHDFVVRNVVRIGTVFLRVALTLWLLTLQASLVMLAAVQLACLVFDFTVSLVLIRRRYPGLRVRLADFDWRMVKQIFSFSMYVLLLSVGARLSFETDALVIGAFIGRRRDSVLRRREQSRRLPDGIHDRDRRGRRADGHQAEHGGAAGGAGGNIPEVVEGLAVVEPDGRPVSDRSGTAVHRMVDRSRLRSAFRGRAGNPHDFESRVPAGPRRRAPASDGARQTAHADDRVHRRGPAESRAQHSRSRGPFGLAGVALGTAIPNVLFAAIVLVVACRELEISVMSYLRYVVPRATIGAIPPLVLLLWFRVGVDVQNIAGLVAAGAAMFMVFAVTWVLFVYRDDPYVDLTPHLGRLRVWTAFRPTIW